MSEQEMLRNEVRKHLGEVGDDIAKYRNFLNTMAKFHKYSLVEQFNLHGCAPDDATAVASEDIWRKVFHTELAADAAGIPLLVAQPDNQYAIRYVYDVRDTVGFRNGDAELQDVLWDFTPADELAAKHALGGAQGQSLDAVIQEKAATLIRERHIEPADFIAHSVEYVVRARLGLPQSQISSMEESIPQNVHIAVILNSVHEVSKDILDALGNAIRAEHERAHRDKEAESNDRGRNPAQPLWRMGEYETGLFAPDAAGRVGEDGARGDRGAVSERLRRRGVRSVRTDDGGGLQAGRSNGGTQEARRDEVDPSVQQRPRGSAGDSAVRGDASDRGSTHVGSLSIEIPQELNAEAAEGIFSEIQRAREEGRITEMESRDRYLSFVRELMSADGMGQEERDALIGRAYYAVAVTYGSVPERRTSSQAQEAAAPSVGTSPDIPEEPSMEMSIKAWYRGHHGDDPSGEFLHDITFRELDDALPMGSALYPYAGIDSSDVREILFTQLAELSGRSYDDIARAWIGTPAAEVRREHEEAVIVEESTIEAEVQALADPTGDAVSDDTARGKPEERPAEPSRAAAEQAVEKPIAGQPFPNPEVTAESGSSIPEELAPGSTEGEQEHTVDLSRLDLAADMTTTVGKRAVFQRNLAAVQIANDLEQSGRMATEEELAVLRAYSGFGGIPEAFDARNASWHSEYEQAKGIMTDAEFTSARASTLDAFYTPPEIIQAIYGGLHNAGFRAGNILDPSTGTGRFLQYMPEDMKRESIRVGVELDLLTAKIARYSSDNARIIQRGFERTRFPNHSFDLAISNVPFGDYIITDTNYAKNYFVHDYFLKKMMDEVRPGGLVVAITSHGTMDKKDETLRRELAQKGELIRAVRLPNRLFAGAGTDALSDLLIFRKRERELAADAPLPEWVHADRQESNDYRGGKFITSEYYVNHYFVEHPEDILGTPSVRSSAFGITPYVDGHDGKALAEELSAALASLPEQTYQQKAQSLPPPKEEEAPEKNQPFGYYEKDGDIVYFSPEGTIETQNFDKKSAAQVRLAMQIRDRIHAMYDAELRDCSDAELIQHQSALRELYDTYTKTYGNIFKDTRLRRSFANDASYPLLTSLEVIEDGELVGLSDIFSKRTIHAYTPPTHADTPSEALMISMQEKGKVDIPYMSSLTELSPEEIVGDLEYVSIFEDIETNTYVPADEYLSGDVRGRMERLEQQRQKWQQEMEGIAKEQTFPIPKLFSYSASNTKISVDENKLQRWNALRDFSDAEKEELFRKENRGAFYHVMKSAAPHIRERYFRFLENRPEAVQELNDPLFYLECLRNDLRFDFTINDTHRIFSDTLDAIGIGKRDSGGLIDSKMMGFLYQAFSAYQNGAYPEALEIGRLAIDLQEYQHSYDERLKQVCESSTDPLITYLRGEIRRAEKNYAALEKVKPKDLTADEIKINLGATWIAAEDIEQFIADTLECRSLQRIVQYAPATGEWKVEKTNHIYANKVKMYSTYGTQETSALDVLEAALNHRQIRIRDDNGIVNERASLLIAQKMDDLRDAFLKWVYQDEDRKRRLVSYYNRHFNNIVPRTFDGSRLTFPGMNPEIELKSHQKNAVARTMFGGNTLLAHVVGAGKTFEMQASAMESKRIGLCKKSLMIMPGHLTEQFGAEFLRLYPNAKILVATPKDFQKGKRAEFCAKITGQDWDAVIMSYEQFGKIPLSLERQEQFVKHEIEQLTDSLSQMKEERSGSGFSIKQTEKQIKTLQRKYAAIMDAYQNRQDATITFEQLGVDRLYVDEAHFYKNLSFTTKIQGLNATGAEKSTDLLAKIQYLNEITNERGVIFATGTPISNSMAELYTMQRYLRPSRLESQGLYHFDAWASTFGQETTTMEIDPAGKGFRAKTRFARFNNIPELTSMFKEFADVKTAESLKLPVPAYDIEIVKADASAVQKELVDRLAERAKRIRQRNPIKLREGADPSSGKGMDNMLVVIKEGQSAALNPRILDADYEDNPTGKVSLCADNVYDIYQKTTVQKSTQVIFCDQSTPNSKAPYNVYNDLREKLMERGVPKEQIAFIHDYDTPEKKERLFAKVRKGDVRILLGSSDKLGVGTNIQNKLIASHDLDCPWKPSQIEQRFGRIVRRGNENKQVKIFRYVTDATFDSYMWQTNEVKQRFISQVFTEQIPAREAEDVDEFTMTYAQLKAACTGNPLYKEQFELRNDLQKLEAERAQYLDDHARMENQLNVHLPVAIKTADSFVQALRADVNTLNVHSQDESLVLQGETYRTPEEIGKAFAECARAIYDGQLTETPRGEYRGLKVSVVRGDKRGMEVALTGMSSTRFPIGLTTPEENASRLANAPKRIDEKLASAAAELDRLNQEVKDCKEGLGKPFAKEEEYRAKTRRMNEVSLQIEEQNKKEERAETKGLEQQNAVTR